jgi:hypothetical protein
VSNVIDFLERLGRDAELRHASDEAVNEALREAGIDPAVRQAIVGKDQCELERLLGGDTTVCCLIHSPDDDEEEEDEEHEDEEDEDEKAELDSVVAARRVGRVA